METGSPQSSKRKGGSYKFQRLREALRQAVLSGELSGKLPGERELARRYQANAKTISKALTDLTSEGILIRQVGRGTFVAEQLGECSCLARTRRYRWLIRNGESNGRPQVIFDMIASRLRREGHELEHQAVEADEAGLLAAGWATPGELRCVDGVIIHASKPSRELVSDLHRRRIPVVLAGCSSETIKCNAVQPDWAGAVFELTEQLLWSGHQRVALAMPRHRPLLAAEAERGYRAALVRAGRPDQASVIKDDDNQLAAVTAAPDCPTAIVAFFREGRARVQRAFSHVNAQQTPAIATILPPGDTPLPDDDGLAYNFDKEVFADWTVRLLLEATPGHQPRQVILPGRITGLAGASSPHAPSGPRSAVSL